MSKLTYTINYRSYVNDPYSCLVGGGYGYSGANFSIREFTLYSFNFNEN